MYIKDQEIYCKLYIIWGVLLIFKFYISFYKTILHIPL